MARGEKEPVETNMQCCLFTTKPPTMTSCHGILIYIYTAEEEVEVHNCQCVGCRYLTEKPSL